MKTGPRDCEVLFGPHKSLNTHKSDISAEPPIRTFLNVCKPISSCSISKQDRVERYIILQCNIISRISKPFLRHTICIKIYAGLQRFPSKTVLKLKKKKKTYSMTRYLMTAKKKINIWKIKRYLYKLNILILDKNIFDPVNNFQKYKNIFLHCKI